MDEHVFLLKTLADPTRLKLFKLILSEELCVCELQPLLGISQPAVSQHMAKLRAAGLVLERRAGQWTYYRGDLERVTSALGDLSAFLVADPATIPALAEPLARRAALCRTDMCGPDAEGGCNSCG